MYFMFPVFILKKSALPPLVTGKIQRLEVIKVSKFTWKNFSKNLKLALETNETPH